MIMPKLTKKFIENHIQFPVRGQSFYPDTALPGFWLRVTPHRIYYIVRWKAQAGDRSVTIGSFDSLNADDARMEATKILAAMSDGERIDESTKQACTITLGRVLEKYLCIRTLRPSTQKVYRQIFMRCLGDWRDMPVCSITKTMVESRHRELCRTTRFGTDGKGDANFAMRLLRTLLNFAADHYETVDGQPIMLVNPVRRLSQNKSWYRIYPRNTMIPDYKLADWYKTLMFLKNRTAADYLLFMLLTGLRRNEAATLRWSDIDMDARVLVVRAEISKNHREHRLPTSAFIHKLLQRRLAERGKSDYIFPGRGGRGHISNLRFVTEEIRTKTGLAFVIHDLRRTFLTMAEKLDVPHYALKKLANHIPLNDVTANYVVLDIERLRIHMSRITDAFLALLFPVGDDRI